MEKAQISNPRFELISSSFKGYKEVQVIFDYQGKNKKYFVFVKESKGVNYINEAKKKFEEDVNSGKVAKMLKRAGKGYIGRPWLIATASVLGVAAITFASLFTWKMLTNTSEDVPQPQPEPPEPSTAWYLSDDYINSLTTADVGTINLVKVNGVSHRVRLIGIDHDTLADDSNKKAHTTWEFADLISDSNGYSLATLWNDIETPPSVEFPSYIPCGDYFNSSIRYALVGKYDGDKKPSFGWYEKGEGEKSDTYTKPVIDMLPSDLVEKIKPVQKDVSIYDPNIGRHDIDIQTCEDKLFILCYAELGTPDEQTTMPAQIYDYYKGAPAGTNKDIRRVKRQIKWQTSEGAGTAATGVTDSIEAKKTGAPSESIAGYNSTYVVDETQVPAGSGYWLRDYNASWRRPYGASSQGGVCADESGLNHGDANTLATPIAPAFCL